MLLSPYLVGIDLGTTNCAVAYVDARTIRDPARLRPTRFPVPQLVAPREVAPAPVLPSFLYFGTAHEQESHELAVPWHAGAADAVGLYARDHGALVPARQVASAKSWLAHGAVDRTAPLLPFGREPGEPGISPLDASTRYLRHIRDAWNHVMAAVSAHRLEEQQVVLTVPASFDEEARELTATAARDAGLSRVVLLEEPIAALYAWLSARRGRRAPRLAPGSVVLVCDVGGGTTDFSLIRARDDDERAGFERIAIGEHLLLGGDNLDLSLATLVEERLGARLSLARRDGLRRQCSAAKEQLLSGDDRSSVAVTVLGGGRAVVGGAQTAALTRQDVLDRLLGGFLPVVDPHERPARDRRQALRELGLPYEPDPAITRHLAGFLAQGGPELERPDAVLFNGGFFAPAVARERVVGTLASWFGAAPAVLSTEQPDAAVALGAAFYAALRAVPGAPGHLLVRAGSARTYYIELAGEGAGNGHVHAVTVMPRGADEGSRLALEGQRFRVATNRPISFTLWSSTTRQDAPGTVIDELPEALHRHAPLVAVLRYGKRSLHAEVEVRLSVHLTEVGTLEVWLDSHTGHRWRLHFEVRGVSPSVEDDERAPDGVVVGEDAIAAAAALVRGVYAGAGEAGATPGTLTSALEERLGYGKQAWPIEALRPLADALLAVGGGRARSAAHESRWLNLVGFCVRPGFGASADAWRIGELRKVYTSGLVFAKDVQCQAEWLVLWLRASGGFSLGQQQELAMRLTASLGLGSRKPPRLNPQIERESWRLLASLERLDVGSRVRIGDAIVERLRREPRNASLIWSIGRVGARVPFYGPLDRVVPADAAERWIGAVIRASTGPEAAAALAQLAAMTGDLARDVSERARERVVEQLRALEASDDLVQQVTAPQTADRWRQGMRYFGEELPAGLRLA